MIRSAKLLIAFVALFLISGVTMKAQDGATSSLSPGDQIRITVWKNPELSGDFTISSNGTILHPLYRDVQVTGLSMSAIEDRIRTFLLKFQTAPQFVVQPLVRIVVGGEVKNPNVYSVPPETTIAQAVAIAGGGTERAKFKDVRIVREHQEVRVDLRRPESDAASLQIRSGDQILVSRGRPPILQIIAPVTSTIAATAAIVSIVLR